MGLCKQGHLQGQLSNFWFSVVLLRRFIAAVDVDVGKVTCAKSRRIYQLVHLIEQELGFVLFYLFQVILQVKLHHLILQYDTVLNQHF